MQAQVSTRWNCSRSSSPSMTSHIWYVGFAFSSTVLSRSASFNFLAYWFLINGADALCFQPDPLDASAVAQYLISQIPGKAYSSICHHPGLNASETSCFTSVSEPGSSPTLTLSFNPGAREDWLAALRREKAIIVDGVKYDVDAGKRHESIGEMKSTKWVAYALSALVLRFWELTKVRICLS